MKLLQSRYLWIMTSFILFVGYWVGCTKNDQVIQPAATTSSSTLVSLKVSAAPTIDGIIDDMWDNAAKVNVLPQVPDPGNSLFAGYIGQTYNGTLRSMYDDQNIYFLLEIKDATQSTNVSPWYFNPAQNVSGKTGWQREPSSKTFDVDGVLTREGWGEDKIAMLWNIDNSTAKFASQTCYASCHVFTPYLDYSVTPAVAKSNSASGNHYTNGPNEKIDMWWGRLGYISKDPTLNFIDDNYQDFAGGPAVTNLTGGSANGRHVDGISVDTAKTYFWPYAPHYSSSPAQGEVTNTQNLKLDNTGEPVAVPLWVNPGFTSRDFILGTETTSGVAKKVVGVSSAGVLTLSDGTLITPGADFQRSASPTGATAKNSIPSIIASPLLGGRLDITCSAKYIGSGWVIEYKRALKTTDVLNQDIDFTKDKVGNQLHDQVFGIAVWDKSNYQHGIKPNLLLKFQQ